MAKNDIMTTVSRSFNKALFQVKKHSPEILIGAGVIGVTASAVMACKATLKVNDILDESKENIEKIHVATEKGYTEAGADYSEEDSKKDLTIVYVQTGVKLVKLYAPAVAVGALSLAGIIKSHQILTTRNAALAAAFTAVDKGFKEYRGRVIERFGKELDQELKYGIKAKEIEVKTVNEDGSEVTEKMTVDVYDPNNYSPYARIFDDGCNGWDKDTEYNLMFLKKTQAYANEKLKKQGYLYLNDVYEMLGFPKTKAGHVVGWIYDEVNPVGDNFVDFGFMNMYSEKARDFVNGYERVVVLDFNVDGNIYELMS